jgi:hypothetical protein
MIRPAKNRLSRILVPVFTALAVMAGFYLAATELPRIASSGTRGGGTGRVFICAGEFNTQESALRRGGLETVKKGNNPRAQPPYKNNIPRPLAAGPVIPSGGLTPSARSVLPGDGVPSPAEDPALFIKTGDTQFIPLRTGLQRIFIPCGIRGAASLLYHPPFGISSGISYINGKNTILLKLRI